MNLTLTPEAKQFVEAQIKAGHFQTLDEVVGEALNRMKFEDEFELDDETVAAIQEADDQFKRGDFLQFSEVADRMKKLMSGR